MTQAMVFRRELDAGDGDVYAYQSLSTLQRFGKTCESVGFIHEPGNFASAIDPTTVRSIEAEYRRYVGATQAGAPSPPCLPPYVCVVWFDDPEMGHDQAQLQCRCAVVLFRIVQFIVRDQVRCRLEFVVAFRSKPPTFCQKATRLHAYCAKGFPRGRPAPLVARPRWCPEAWARNSRFALVLDPPM